MNVICVDVDNVGSALTIGKDYQVFLENNIGYYITDDSGITHWYSKWRFSISEWREKQLNKLL